MFILSLYMVLFPVFYIKLEEICLVAQLCSSSRTLISISSVHIFMGLIMTLLFPEVTGKMCSLPVKHDDNTILEKTK